MYHIIYMVLRENNHSLTPEVKVWLVGETLVDAITTPLEGKKTTFPIEKFGIVNVLMSVAGWLMSSCD